MSITPESQQPEGHDAEIDLTTVDSRAGQSDPWAQMRSMRETDAALSEGEHEPVNTKDLPMGLVWRYWVLTTIPRWFLSQTPREDEVPHSSDFISVTFLTSVRKGEEGHRSRTVIPLIVGGRRVSKLSAISAGVASLFLLGIVSRLVGG